MSLQEKQEYLRKHIMEAGKDIQKFVEYFQKHHSLEILQQCPMEIIIKIVQQFINMQFNESKHFVQNNINQKLSPNTSKTTNKTDILQMNSQSLGLINNNLIYSNNAEASKPQITFTDDDWKLFFNDFSQSKQKEPSFYQNKKQSIMFTQISNGKLEQKSQFNLIKQQKSNNIEFDLEQPKKDSNAIKFIKSQTFLQMKKQKQLLHKSESSLNNKIQNYINSHNIIIRSFEEQIPQFPQVNEVVISMTEQKARNILQSDYTIYHIELLPSKHMFQRRFNDFRKFRQLLHRQFPTLRLPYLEAESWLMGSQGTDQSTLKRYKFMIIQFMRFILIENNQLKNSSLVRKFCNLEQKVDFKVFFQGIKPKTIQQLMMGNIILPRTDKNQTFLQNTSDIITDLQNHYEKIRKQLQGVNYQYDTLRKSLGQVTESFNNLQEAISYYNFKNDEKKELIIYQGMKDVCKQIIKILSEQQQMFMGRINAMLIYQKENIGTLRELFECRNKIHAEYAKQESPKIQNTGVIEVNTKIPIDEPMRGNKQVLIIQEVFWKHHCTEEIKHYWKHLRTKIQQCLTNIAYDQLDKENACLNFWNALIKKTLM